MRWSCTASYRDIAKAKRIANTHKPIILTHGNMPVLNQKPNRFQMSYKRKELELILPMEQFLADELCTDRSGVHKVAIKYLYSERKKVQQGLF